MSNEEIENHYRSLINLFEQDGWKAFQEDIKETFEATNNSWDTLPSSEELLVCKGTVQQLRRFMNYETYIRQSYDQFQESQHTDNLFGEQN